MLLTRWRKKTIIKIQFVETGTPRPSIHRQSKPFYFAQRIGGFFYFPMIMNIPFQTSDLALCAALQVLGFNIESIDRSDPRRVLFSIPRSAELDDAIQEFWKRTLLVEPGAYFQSLRLLKSRIRQ